MRFTRSIPVVFASFVLPCLPSATSCRGESTLTTADGDAATGPGGSRGEGGASNSSGGGGGFGGTSGSTSGRAGAGTEGGMISRCVNARQWAPGIDECDGGYLHRSSSERCPTPDWDEGQGGQTSGEECGRDADCAPGTHCVAAPWFTTDCITPECVTDADCALGSICVCAPGYVLGESSREVAFGVCVRAGCFSDADCAGGALCMSPLSRDEATEFHCQSSADECRSPEDCDSDLERCEHDGSRFTCL